MIGNCTDLMVLDLTLELMNSLVLSLTRVDQLRVAIISVGCMLRVTIGFNAMMTSAQLSNQKTFWLSVVEVTGIQLTSTFTENLRSQKNLKKIKKCEELNRYEISHFKYLF
jgi:hypothetical protein